jgi:hypothetical protein
MIDREWWIGIRFLVEADHELRQTGRLELTILSPILQNCPPKLRARCSPARLGMPKPLTGVGMRRPRLLLAWFVTALRAHQRRLLEYLEAEVSVLDTDYHPISGIE